MAVRQAQDDNEVRNQRQNRVGEHNAAVMRARREHRATQEDLEMRLRRLRNPPASTQGPQTLGHERNNRVQHEEDMAIWHWDFS